MMYNSRYIVAHTCIYNWLRFKYPWVWACFICLYASRYQYRVRSYNSAGFVESDWIVIETKQAAPSGVVPPAVNHYGRPIYRTIYIHNIKPSKLVLIFNPSLIWQINCIKIYVLLSFLIPRTECTYCTDIVVWLSMSFVVKQSPTVVIHYRVILQQTVDNVDSSCPG